MTPPSTATTSSPRQDHLANYEVGEKDKFGQNVVLVVRAEDKDKDAKKIASYQFYKQSSPAAGFYGEIRQGAVRSM